MDGIVVENVNYDAYFILGVTPDDSLEHVKKEYRRKAKLLHPDKLSTKDRENPEKILKRSKQFKILRMCFEAISHKFNKYNQKNRDTVNVKTYDNMTPKQFDNREELKLFNDRFPNNVGDTPQSFGYKTDRIGAIDDDGRNFEQLKKQYSNSEFRPQQLFDKKNFDPKNFNAAFEFQQQQYTNGVDDSKLIIHQTSDGFNGYNSATLDNCASVSNFNGVMLVGDNFGQSGIGYNDGNYSDYRQTFNSAKNPEKLNIPKDFQPSVSSVKPLSKNDIEEQLRLRESQFESMNKSCSRENYKTQEQMLLEKQKRDMVIKAEKDKQLILQYQHLFEQQTIEDALNSKLLTSPDYQYFNV